MTWRAFIIGLAAVALISWLDPRTAFVSEQWGTLNTTSFPPGAMFVLVVLTLTLNVLLKLISKMSLVRMWGSPDSPGMLRALVNQVRALNQAELMLVWCMMICSATIPTFGVGRFLYSIIAHPAYHAERSDINWRGEGIMSSMPDGLLLSKDGTSDAVVRYHEGGGEQARVPWKLWIGPLAKWGLFMLFLYLAVYFACAILRRQWMEVERLMFPLARVPLEFSEGSAGKGLLPTLFSNRAFQIGLVVAIALRLVRATPMFFGGEPWKLMLPFKTVLADTPLQHAEFADRPFWPYAMGFAYLVPADVSLSVWFFVLFARAELMVSHYLALGYKPGRFMAWQQLGSYASFVVILLYMSRRHLLGVVRKAFGSSKGADDSDEPVRYPIAFWGFWVAIAGCLAWYYHYGLRGRFLLAGAAMLLIMFSAYLVYTRVVCQAGLHICRVMWKGHLVIHGVSGGAALNGPAAVLTGLQETLLIRGGSVALMPMAMNAFRISEVFGKRKRWLVPAMIVAMLAAYVATSQSVLSHFYKHGMNNSADRWGQRWVPEWRFGEASRIVKRGLQPEAFWGPFAFGAVVMAGLTLMRMRFYWWPIHSIGFLASGGDHAQYLWVPFLLGWFTKVTIMKYGGGRRLRDGRFFFIAVIAVELFFQGALTVAAYFTEGAVQSF